MSKHTPGPWHVTNGQPTIHTVDHKEVTRITYLIETEQDIEILHANAQLIASAPEMYEVLKGIVFWKGKAREAWIAKAQDIITKAEGK